MPSAASASTARTNLHPTTRKPPDATHHHHNPRTGPPQPLLSTLPLECQSRLLAASATLESTASLLAHSMALMESVPQARRRQERILLRLGRDAADSSTVGAGPAAAAWGGGGVSGDPWAEGVEWPEEEDEAALEREDRRRLFYGMKWSVRAENRRMRVNALVARRKAEEAERAWREGVRWEGSGREGGEGAEEGMDEEGMDVDRGGEEERDDEDEDEGEDEEDDEEDSEG